MRNIVIFNFDDQNPVGNKKQPYEVKFDKDGYPIPDGETLQLTPQEKHSYLWGLITYETGGEYTYIANGKENIAEIKDKFHLNKGAIHNSNSYYKLQRQELYNDQPKEYCHHGGIGIYG